MNIERFQYLAEAFGGDLSRWPAGEQKAAAALLRASPAARRALDEALALDALLNKATQDDDPKRVDRMAAAITARLSDRPRAPAPPRLLAPRWIAGFLCVMALAGALTGAQIGPTVQPSAQTAAAVSLADLAEVSGYSSTRLLTAWVQ
ncbi:MAG TPA: hypothetical protein PKZ99_11870 [Azospirillaceae bacterium]|nr:hypothetical protein [Azospirillaceae bacterium]